MRKKKKVDKPDKKFTSLDSIKYKNVVYEINSRYRLNKPINKIPKDQLVEIIQIISESSCKIQSFFDHSTAVVNFLDLYDI
jgi:hypothetical protein